MNKDLVSVGHLKKQSSLYVYCLPSACYSELSPLSSGPSDNEKSIIALAKHLDQSNPTVDSGDLRGALTILGGPPLSVNNQ